VLYSSKLTNPSAARRALKPDVTASHAPDSLRPGFVHLGASRELGPILLELGMPADQIIREAGMDPGLFESAESVVSFSALGHLMSIAAERVQCPHLGLLIGERARLTSLGLLGWLMRSAPTLGQALRALDQHFFVRSRAAVFRLDIGNELAILSYSPYEPGAPGAALQCDAGIGAIVAVIRLLLGQPSWTPSEVLLPRRCPRDVAPYRNFFRAPVRYDRETAALVLPAQDLDEGICGADPADYLVLTMQLGEVEASSEVDFTDQLRRMLRTEILATGCSVRRVAGQLEVDRRTVHRRLSAEGRTFRAVAGEVRYEIARQLLSDTGMSLGQISAVLDFSEPAAFTRAFRRWSGTSPSAWREYQAHAPLHLSVTQGRFELGEAAAESDLAS
jgi:AraC-like DNA-binding protein